MSRAMSIRVGTLSACSHNGWQPSALPCEECRKALALAVNEQVDRAQQRLYGEHERGDKAETRPLSYHDSFDTWEAQTASRCAYRNVRTGEVRSFEAMEEAKRIVQKHPSRVYAYVGPLPTGPAKHDVLWTDIAGINSVARGDKDKAPES